MKIRRSRLTGDFLQVPNATVRDDRLSHMARGILVELLSRPDGWEATADDMWQASVAKHGKDSPGRRMFRAAFAELKAHGYLTAGRGALAGGRHATVLTLTDVPHAGTSKEENGETKTGKNTTSSSAAAKEDDEDLSAFGAFWLVYPKSRNRPATLAAWREALAKGATPEKITAAAQAYARERAGEDQRYTKYSANWLREERYEDDYAFANTPGERPQLRAVSGGWQPWRNPTDQSVYDEPLI